MINMIDEILIFIKDNSNIITLLGICLTFSVSIISMYFTIRNNKAIHYVNAITKNRVEWLYKLKEYISEFSSVTMLEMADLYAKDVKDRELHFSTIEKLRNLIYMHLNFKDDIDNKIINSIDQIITAHNEAYQLSQLYYEKGQVKEINLSAAHFAIYPVVKRIACSYFHIQDEGDEGENECIDKFYEIKDNELMLAEFMMYFYNETGKIFSRINSLRDILIGHVRIYLKFEWNRIKIEAKGKKYTKYRQNKDLKKLYSDYKKINPSVQLTL
jgi:hypothetical protein